jgi:hypothetical protein
MMQYDACVLHITMFGVKGELQSTNHNNSYTVSKHAPSFFSYSILDARTSSWLNYHVCLVLWSLDMN